MTRTGLFALALAAAGCASAPLARDLESASPQEGIVVSCSGFKSWPDCDRAAARACPNGYVLLGKEENLVTQGRTMRIQCR